ncbi:ornithine cyclodeaminase family protein [Gimesia fumaroli]|uniref:L-lysine cyclodeaminase n=1 Tax=Gimesia fumaroli TaxID=2527976 RepID=A0A518IJF1_9PLAN|nr:ornithine cyclodeaminase family protein [Gimesia fumaroli]QDV53223.1 L-lysine cyclodeaminase [Gimesia fumaroli]
MAALYITEDDVRSVMDMEKSILITHKVFKELASGRAINVPRQRVRAPGIMLHTMSAANEYLNYVGWKAYTTTKEGAQFHVAIYDQESGEMRALIEGDFLGQLRTGAASGVATEYMARPDSKVVGLFGAGLQARTQLQAVCQTRKIEFVSVYSRDHEKCTRFAAEMTELCDVEVSASHSPDETAAEKDIVICATTSKAPLFDGRVLDEGTHLNVIGSNHRTRREIDRTTIKRADVIVCDDIDQCKNEAGDFIQPVEEGITDWRLMHNLSEIVAERQTGRATDDQVTLFKSVGLAVEDVAMAVKVYELALEEDLGSDLPF